MSDAAELLFPDRADPLDPATYLVRNPWNYYGVTMMRVSRRQEGELPLADRIRRSGEVTLGDVHGVVFLAFAAARVRLIDAVEALSDTGIVHSAVHLALGDPFVGQTLEGFADEVEALQERVDRAYGFDLDA